MNRDGIVREAAEALFKGKGHARALWRIISNADEDLYKLLRGYRFADKTEFREDIEDRIESLEQLDE